MMSKNALVRVQRVSKKGEVKHGAASSKGTFRPWYLCLRGLCLRQKANQSNKQKNRWGSHCHSSNQGRGFPTPSV